MQGISRFVKIVAVLIVSIFVIIFVLENQQTVALSFLGWITRPLPVSLFFIGSLILGLAIAPLVIFIGRVAGARPKLKR